MKKYEVVYSVDAIKDMDEIWEGVWNASRDLDTADEYIRDLSKVISRAGQLPKGGIPVYYKGLFTGIYFVRFKAYLAFYRIRGSRVEIGRVLLRKRDYLRILFGDDEIDSSELE